MKLKTLVPALICCACAGYAIADDRDAANTARAERALADRMTLQDDSITVSTRDGHMVLTGVVDSPHDAGVAMITAAEATDGTGVHKVENELQIRHP